MQIVQDTVEVATTQAGYRFPKDHPTRLVVTKEGTPEEKKKTMYVIPVTYVDPEDADFDVSEEYAEECRKQGVADITAAFKAGVRLAIGKVAKDQYAEESSGGKKVLLAAVSWIASTPMLAEWAAFHQAGQPDKADEFALTKYRAR